MGACLIYIFGSTILRLCFPTSEEREHILRMTVVDVVVDVILVIDVLLRRFSVAFYCATAVPIVGLDIEGNTRRRDPARARKAAYAGSTAFWIDALAALPADWIVGAAASSYDGRLIYFRLNKALRLFLADRHSGYITTYSIFVRKSALWTNTNVRRAGTLFLAMAFVANVTGALFYLVAYVETKYGDNPVTWAFNDGINVTQPGDLFHKYLRSVYWAVITQVTTGFGDIVPANTIAETLFTVGAMYAGVLVTCSAVANLTNLIAGIDSRGFKYERNVMLLKKFIQRMSLKPDTASRVLHYFEYAHSHNMDDDATERMLVANLPRELTVRIRGMAVSTQSPAFSSAEGYAHLRSVPQLHALGKTPTTTKLLYDLATSLEKVVYTPGDDIVGEGHILKGMRFLSRGKHGA